MLSENAPPAEKSQRTRALLAVSEHKKMLVLITTSSSGFTLAPPAVPRQLAPVTVANVVMQTMADLRFFVSVADLEPHSLWAQCGQGQNRGLLLFGSVLAPTRPQSWP